MWGTVLKRDLLGETREEDKFYTREKLQEYLKSEIEKQGENVVIRNLDVSRITDLSDLFYGYNSIKTLDISGWKTSEVNNIAGMFYNCEKLESLDISRWDISNVKDMSFMFNDCFNLKDLDLSGWKTSNIEDTSWMFFRCENLK